MLCAESIGTSVKRATSLYKQETVDLDSPFTDFNIHIHMLFLAPFTVLSCAFECSASSAILVTFQFLCLCAFQSESCPFFLVYTVLGGKRAFEKPVINITILASLYRFGSNFIVCGIFCNDLAVKANGRWESMARMRMVIWVWIVLAGFCGLTLSETQQQCPPRLEISPCTCYVKKNGLDILCDYTDQQHISNAMAALKGKSFVIFYLKLRHNILRKLPGFVFLGLDIRHLTIHNSSLSVVEEASLSSIGKMLTQLDVSQNSLTSVPSTAYKNLHQLLILNMNHNRINSLHSRAFEGLDTLEILTLYENKITTVDQEAFVGLEKKLKRLNLGGNALTSVPQKSLSILDMLRKLEMQENKISEIHEEDFEGLKNLDSLGLAHNKIKVVPARVFSHLTLLNSLELDGNNINQIDPEAFYGLEGL
ncbi:hypothetical protein Trydic_g15891 [Trypoxylus dichotomus]